MDGYCDWRLPTITELLTLLLEPHPCSSDPCIDPIFGPTVPDFYWASTTKDDSTGLLVQFQTGALFEGNLDFAAHARPVRSAF